MTQPKRPDLRTLGYSPHSYSRATDWVGVVIFFLNLIAIPYFRVSQAMASSAQAYASAEIVEPVSVSELRPLEFGTRAPASKAVASESGPQVTPLAPLVQEVSESGKASFQLVGPPLGAFSVSLPEEVRLVSSSDSNSLKTVSITGLRSHPAKVGTLNREGQEILDVTVPKPQLPDFLQTYTGRFTLTIIY